MSDCVTQMHSARKGEITDAICSMPISRTIGDGITELAAQTGRAAPGVVAG